ncbi:MAG: hypothetical protein J5910_09500 [Lachnospiraceae bacterium]|nr:hypothetical protein [Lachnospiraceae bacterium]
MLVYVCPKCKYTDVLDEQGGDCRRCGTGYVSLGLSTLEYNDLDSDQVEKLINEKTGLTETVEEDAEEIAEDEEVEEVEEDEETEEIEEDDEVEETGEVEESEEIRPKAVKKPAGSAKRVNTKRITEGVSAQMFTQSAGNLIKKIKDTKIEDVVGSVDEEDSTEIDAAYQNLNKKTLGVAVAMSPGVFFAIAALMNLILPRALQDPVDIIILIPAGVAWLASIFYFAGIGRVLKVAGKIITLNGLLVFTIYGIPVMIFTFFMAVILLIMFPVIPVYSAYKEEKERFDDICALAGMRADEAGSKVRKMNKRLKIAVAVCGVFYLGLLALIMAPNFIKK